MDELLRMLELASQGFHCSQILLFMGLDAQSKENPDLIRAMSALAGGLGFSGDACGALTGGACLLGLYAGRGTLDEEDDPRLNVMIAELLEWFTGECGEDCAGVHCSDIVGDDPEKQRTICPGLVAGTYEKVKTLLLENGFQMEESR